ncbi:hypothetical protein fugu_005632 [Takifugu bimaculatus]|uniref:Uncharacterized protein n=1 Tax=Takifugu bimaculatus TaxID=433685 RepID=A0A4Z2B4X6_9TELE|nr:hypothetical protein fugu_005632 [Takifugu bimaculatus]
MRVRGGGRRSGRASEERRDVLKCPPREVGTCTQPTRTRSSGGEGRTQTRRLCGAFERASLSISLLQPGLKGEDVPSHLSCVTRLSMKGSGIKKTKTKPRKARGRG